MKDKKSLKILFSFWIILLIISISWVGFQIFTNINSILIEPVYQFVLVFCSVSFVLVYFSLKDIVEEVNSDILDNNRKEKSVRDYFQYTQLLDPPSLNN